MKWQIGLQGLEYNQILKILVDNKVENSIELQKELLFQSTNSAGELFTYARILGRCELFEDIISTVSRITYLYARDVIKGRLPELMHNKMLAKAIETPSDYYILKYFQLTKETI